MILLVGCHKFGKRKTGGISRNLFRLPGRDYAQFLTRKLFWEVKFKYLRIIGDIFVSKILIQTFTSFHSAVLVGDPRNFHSSFFAKT